RTGHADADQGRAVHVRMHVEHRLDLFGVERAVGGFDAVRLATAEPQPPLVVEPAQVAHAVDDAVLPATRRLADLGQPRLRLAVEVGVGHARPGHGDLADFAIGHGQLVGPVVDRLVADADDAHPVRRHRPTDAGARAALGALAQGQQFTSL